jgi:hypothetical protein
LPQPNAYWDASEPNAYSYSYAYADSYACGDGNSYSNGHSDWDA